MKLLGLTQNAILLIPRGRLIDSNRLTSRTESPERLLIRMATVWVAPVGLTHCFTIDYY